MRILSTYPSEGKSKINPRTDARGASSGLGVVTARAAHATAEACVTRRRHLFIAEEGTRNVAEDAPAFVYSRGRKIVAGVDASASSVDALHRHAQRAESEQAPTWQGRRAA
jgi:hypothetical protein